jgi:hypothetical protein
MAAIVSLHAVVEEMDMLCEGMHAYLNRRTGELYGGSDEQLFKAEEECDDDELLEWEVEIVHKLREILESSDWIELPVRQTHEQYRLMERFCLERCEGRLQDELLSAINGRGAFGRFKDCILRRRVRDDWFAFRREALEADAAAWLESLGIEHGP